MTTNDRSRLRKSTKFRSAIIPQFPQKSAKNLSPSVGTPAEDLPVPSLRVSGSRTTVRRHCDCVANLAPIINRHTYLPTYLQPVNLCNNIWQSCGMTVKCSCAEIVSDDFSKTFSFSMDYIYTVWFWLQVVLVRIKGFILQRLSRICLPVTNAHWWQVNIFC